MKIVRVRLLNSENEIWDFTIVKKEDEKDASDYKYVPEEDVYVEEKDMIVREVSQNAPIADAILRAIAKGGYYLTLKDSEHVIDSFEYFADGEKLNPYSKMNSHLEEYTLDDDIVEIIVFNRNCTCKTCYDMPGYKGTENISIKVAAYGEGDSLYEIDVQRCKHCNRFFINEKSLEMYERKYGVILFVRRITEGLSYKRESSSYKKDSVLSRYGYSAGQNCPPDAIRQAILAYLIESKVSSKAEIKELLGGFLISREKRCPYAAKIWEKDLQYVNEYNYNNKKIEQKGRFVQKNK